MTTRRKENYKVAVEKRLHVNKRYNSFGIDVAKPDLSVDRAGNLGMTQNEIDAAACAKMFGGASFTDLISSGFHIAQSGSYWATGAPVATSLDTIQPVDNCSTHEVPLMPAKKVKSVPLPVEMVPSEMKIAPELVNVAVNVMRSAARAVRGEGDVLGNLAVQGGPEELQRQSVAIPAFAVKVLGACTAVSRGYVLAGLSPGYSIRRQNAATVLDIRSPGLPLPTQGMPLDVVGFLATALLPNEVLHFRNPNDHAKMDAFYRNDLIGFRHQVWFSDIPFVVGPAACTPLAAAHTYDWLMARIPAKMASKCLRTVGQLRLVYGPLRAPAGAAEDGGLYSVVRPACVFRDNWVHGEQVAAANILGAGAFADNAFAEPPPLAAFGAELPRLGVAVVPGEVRLATEPDRHVLNDFANEILAAGGFAVRATRLVIVPGIAEQLNSAGAVVAAEVEGTLEIYWAGPAANAPPAQPVAAPINNAGPGFNASAVGLDTWKALWLFAVGASHVVCPRIQDLPGYVPLPADNRDEGIRNYAGLLDSPSTLVVPVLATAGIGAWMFGALVLATRTRDTPGDEEAYPVPFAESFDYALAAARVMHQRFNATRYVTGGDPTGCAVDRPAGAEFHAFDNAPVSGYVSPDTVTKATDPGPTIECQETPMVGGLLGARAAGRCLDGGFYTAIRQGNGLLFSLAQNNPKALDSLVRYLLTTGRAADVRFRDNPALQPRVANLTAAAVPLVGNFFLIYRQIRFTVALKTEYILSGLGSAVASGNTASLTSMFA